MMPANELAAVIVKALDAKKGENIQLLKTQDLTTLADYFVICTASSSTCSGWDSRRLRCLSVVA